MGDRNVWEREKDKLTQDYDTQIKNLQEELGVQKDCAKLCRKNNTEMQSQLRDLQLHATRREREYKAHGVELIAQRDKARAEAAEAHARAETAARELQEIKAQVEKEREEEKARIEGAELRFKKATEEAA